MKLLIKITLVLAVSVMTFQPMAAKKDEPSYNLSRALEEARQQAECNGILQQRSNR